jgi:glycine/D-amino acid oxidase-like deaminating enzyme
VPPSSSLSVAVIGGGFVGLSAAYYLAKAGVDVTIFEREAPGWGASGRNAGFLSLMARSPGPELELAVEGRKHYDELTRGLDNFDFRASGLLAYFFEDQARLVDEFAARRRADGVSVSVLDPDDARDLCPLLPENVAGAAYSADDAFIHPGKLSQALSDAALREGAHLRTEAALSLEISAGRVTGLRTSAGGIAVDAAVVAAGPWSAQFLRQHDIPLNIIPVLSELAETAPIEQRFDVPVFGPSFFHHYTFVRELTGYDDDLVLPPMERVYSDVGALELWAQRADGRLILGNAVEVADGDTPTVAGMALTFGILAEHVPALRNIPVERIWGGSIPKTGDGLPVIDAIPGIDGLFVGTGHTFGALTGPLSGRLVTDLILGRTPAVDLTPFEYDRLAITEGRRFVDPTRDR